MKLNFEKFLNDNNLKIGDKVRLSNGKVYEICRGEDKILSLRKEDGYYVLSLLDIYDFEKIEPEKKVDNVKCSDYSCDKCPACCITCFPQLEQQMRPRFEEKSDKEVEE